MRLTDSPPNCSVTRSILNKASMPIAYFINSEIPITGGAVGKMGASHLGRPAHVAALKLVRTLDRNMSVSIRKSLSAIV